MSKTFDRIKELVRQDDIKISDHGYDEITEDGIFVKDIVADVDNGIIVEDYPDYPKGPVCSCIRERQRWASDSCGMGHSKRHIMSCCNSDGIQARG